MVRHSVAQFTRGGMPMQKGLNQPLPIQLILGVEGGGSGSKKTTTVAKLTGGGDGLAILNCVSPVIQVFQNTPKNKQISKR